MLSLVQDKIEKSTLYRFKCSDVVQPVSVGTFSLQKIQQACTIIIILANWRIPIMLAGGHSENVLIRV